MSTMAKTCIVSGIPCGIGNEICEKIATSATKAEMRVISLLLNLFTIA